MRRIEGLSRRCALISVQSRVSFRCNRVSNTGGVPLTGVGRSGSLLPGSGLIILYYGDNRVDSRLTRGLHSSKFGTIGLRNNCCD